jgi:HSP90 family molecular chaperone
LLRFNSSQHEDYEISLDEYISEMRKGQTEIYYLAGDISASSMAKSPFLLPYKKKGFDVLFFSDPIDEVVARELRTYEGKPLISVTEGDKNKAESAKEKERMKVCMCLFSFLCLYYLYIYYTFAYRFGSKASNP